MDRVYRELYDEIKPKIEAERKFRLISKISLLSFFALAILVSSLSTVLLGMGQIFYLGLLTLILIAVIIPFLFTYKANTYRITLKDGLFYSFYIILSSLEKYKSDMDEKKHLEKVMHEMKNLKDVVSTYGVGNSGFPESEITYEIQDALFEIPGNLYKKLRKAKLDDILKYENLFLNMLIAVNKNELDRLEKLTEYFKNEKKTEQGAVRKIQGKIINATTLEYFLSLVIMSVIWMFIIYELKLTLPETVEGFFPSAAVFIGMVVSVKKYIFPELKKLLNHGKS